MPSLLEYFGFIYFFGSFLAGPALEIKEYLEFTDMTLFPLVFFSIIFFLHFENLQIC